MRRELGDVAPLLRLARSGRPLLALDGCPLVCVAATLRRHGLTPDGHVVLSDHGVRKRRHVDPDEADLRRLWPLVTDAARDCASSKPGRSGPGARSVSGPAALPDG
ncbi:putative zinc-binding protein [Micromonospora sp. NPDC093277]|uniref:putative zinc-binding protein n=1 Tax=Micromonospora sp. NPDC093277 TaxID=3364291 RepID=UPI0037F3C1AC